MALRTPNWEIGARIDRGVGYRPFYEGMSEGECPPGSDTCYVPVPPRIPVATPFDCDDQPLVRWGHLIGGSQWCPGET